MQFAVILEPEQLALYAEGRTDYYFLLPLLERVCSDLCLREVRGKVDVSPVLGLDHPLAYDDRSREQRIVEAARSALGQWSVLPDEVLRYLQHLEVERRLAARLPCW